MISVCFETEQGIRFCELEQYEKESLFKDMDELLEDLNIEGVPETPKNPVFSSIDDLKEQTEIKLYNSIRLIPKGAPENAQLEYDRLEDVITDSMIREFKDYQRIKKDTSEDLPEFNFNMIFSKLLSQEIKKI